MVAWVCDGDRVDRVAGDAEHLTMQKPVAGEVEGVDLDRRFLAGMDEADVLVRHQRLDLERAFRGHHRHEGLGRGDDAADGVDRQLLHDAVDRCGQGLEPRPLLGLDQLLGEVVRLLLRLGELAEPGAAKLRLGLAPLFADHGERRLGLGQALLLHDQLLLALNHLLLFGQIGQLRVRAGDRRGFCASRGAAARSAVDLTTLIIYYAPDPVCNTDITTPNTHTVNGGQTVLPVELASFTSAINRNNVTLNWSTAKETNNQGFDVERQIVGSNNWATAGNVVGNGTTEETHSYSFTERVNTGNYEYRLKQIDYNGAFNYFTLNGEVIVGVPSTYNMSQNYPNPFNPSTKIDYDLPYDGKVSIILYDISGREVANLVNEVKTAGYYQVNFNASNLASGMYFYRINAQGSANNFVQTKKMVLIK